MPATTTVAYPSAGKFDLDYYLKTHMPLVQKHWESQGLKSWKVVQVEDAEYNIVATLEWGSLEEFQKAAGGEAAGEIFGDIPNFTDQKPILLTGKVVGTS